MLLLVVPTMFMLYKVCAQVSAVWVEHSQEVHVSQRVCAHAVYRQEIASL